MAAARKPAKPRQEPTIAVVESYPVMEFSGWLLEDVAAALDALGRGSLYRAEQLMLALKKDPAYAHGEAVRCATMAGLPLSLHWPADGVPAQQRAELEAHLADLWGGGNSLAVLTKYRVALGVAPAAVTWQLSPSGATWLPVLHAREAGWLTYDATRSLYTYQTREGCEDVIADGKRWLLFTALSGLRPHNEGIERALAALIWMAQAVHRYWGLQYNRAHGSPMRKAKIPGKQRENYDAEKYVRQARDLMGGAVIACPQYGDDGPSFDFELVEATARTWETFPAFLDYVYRWVTLLWLGAWDNTQGGDQGSRARAEVHERVSQRVAAYDCTGTAAPMRPLWRQWCEYNRIQPHLAPHSVFTVSVDREAESKIQQQLGLAAQARGLALQAYGNALKALKDAGTPYDAAHLLRQVGFELTPGDRLSTLDDVPALDERPTT